MAKFDLGAILMILPVLLVITSEHIGHQVVTGKIIGRDLLKDPGLHRSLFGDNFSTMLSGLIGSVPTTTYGENIGVMAVTKVYSVRVIAGAAVLSIICSFVGKLSMLIQTFSGPVIGGISFLLYGMIGASGIRILVDSKVDYGRSRNLTLTSVVFVTGLSGIAVNFGDVQLTGMVLACVVAMILSLIFYVLDKFHLTNDQEESTGNEKNIEKVKKGKQALFACFFVFFFAPADTCVPARFGFLSNFSTIMRIPSSVVISSPASGRRFQMLDDQSTYGIIIIGRKVKI